jgi:hypothetical protein
MITGRINYNFEGALVKDDRCFFCTRVHNQEDRQFAHLFFIMVPMILLSRSGDVDGVPNDRGFMTFYVNLALVLLASLLVGTRFYARLTTIDSLGADDWLILGALVR